MQREYPILEYDDAKKAILEPAGHGVKDAPERCVICFFSEVFDQLRQEGRLQELDRRDWEDGVHVIYQMEHDGEPLVVLHPGVGAPVASGLLEAAIVIGCRKFIACGGAGVLDREIAVGHIVVPTSAVRDEGTSYHYLPASREVEASPEAVAAIEQTLKARGVDYLLGKTWTTDAPYRETPAKVQLRRAEGCLTVEMEAAAFFAVSRFRGVQFGQLLYGGDDVSSEEWDSRDWNRKTSVREALFWLAVESCLSL